MATGLGKPNVPPDIDGIELTEGYEDLPEDGEAFEGKAVAVFGMGNAAFETADAVGMYSNYIHMYTGRKRRSDKGEPSGKSTEQEFTSWESRYVGNLRAINAGMLDAYLLKSLDGIAVSLYAEGMIIRRCGFKALATNHNSSVDADASQIKSGYGQKLCMFITAMPYESPQENAEMDCPVLKTVSLGRFSPFDAWAVKAVASLPTVYDPTTGCLQVGRVYAEQQNNRRVGSGLPVVASGGTDNEGKPLGIRPGDLTSDTYSVHISVSMLDYDGNSTVDLLHELARRSGSPYPFMYDRIVRCLGWGTDLSPYSNLDPDEDLTVKPMLNQGKYPFLDAEYQSVNVKGMYFAGTVAHGKDHKRSAGGFIHGFRYTTRLLFRMLEHKYQPAAAAAEDTGTSWSGSQYNPYINLLDWDGASHGVRSDGCNPGDWDTPIEASTNCAPDPDQHAYRATSGTGFVDLLNRIFARINTASGPYQMVAVLGDGIVFECDGAEVAENTNITGEYYEEVSSEYFHDRFDGLPRLFWSFAYQRQAQKLDVSLNEGTNFEVHFSWYPGTCAPDEPKTNLGSPGTSREKERVALLETYTTNWNLINHRIRVGRWLHTKLAGLVATAEDDVIGGGGAAAAAAAVPSAAVCNPDNVREVLVGCVKKDPALDACINDATKDDCKCLEDPAFLLCADGCASNIMRVLCPELEWQGMITEGGGAVDGGACEADGTCGGEATATAGAATAATAVAAEEAAPPRAKFAFEHNLRPQEAYQFLETAPGMRVDLNIMNLMDTTILLFRSKEFGTAPEPMVLLRPKEIIKIQSTELEAWTAHEMSDEAIATGSDEFGMLIRSWVVDVADGIVQDILCG
jgi:hypothetical protein